MSERLLRKAYYSLREPGSFQGIDALYNVVRAQDPTLTRSRVRKFLSHQNVYLRHLRPRKPPRKSPKFPKYVLTAPGIDVSCDSGYFPHSKLPYVIVCREGFSGKVYAEAQRGLKAKTTLNTMRKMFADHFPGTIYTDLGNEFASIHQLPSHHQTTHDRSQKAFLAEQTIKAIRGKLNRYATFRDSKVDVSKVLPDIVRSINETPNSRTGLSPNQSELPANAGVVFRRKFGNYLKLLEESVRPNFSIGDIVRVAIDSSGNAFAKASKPGFSSETFQVVSVRRTHPPTYILADSNGRRVEGYFRESHMRRAEPDYKNWRKVSKVLKTKKETDGTEWYLVQFKDHPQGYKRWLPEDLYQKLSLPLSQRVWTDCLQRRAEGWSCFFAPEPPPLCKWRGFLLTSVKECFWSPAQCRSFC